MLEGKLHELYRFVEVHEEAGHGGVCDRDGIAGLDLVDKQRDHRAAGAHHVAVASAADDRSAALCRHTGVGGDDVLHHGLGDAHGVDGVGGLIGGEAYHALHASVDGGVQRVVCTHHIRLDGLHREELT